MAGMQPRSIALIGGTGKQGSGLALRFAINRCHMIKHSSSRITGRPTDAGNV